MMNLQSPPNIKHQEMVQLILQLVNFYVIRSINVEASNKMQQLAKLCSNNVVIPEHIQCCGFAGDKGFTTPELNENALATLKEQVPKGCTVGYSNSRTCEIGLSHHAGIDYQSILYLVDKTTSAK